MKSDRCQIGKEVVMLNCKNDSDDYLGLVISSEVIMRNRVAFVEVTNKDKIIHKIPINRLQDKRQHDTIMGFRYTV